MLSFFLKRLLPFTLTLIIGAGLGNVVSLFGSLVSQKARVLMNRQTRVRNCATDEQKIGGSIQRAVITSQPMPRYTEEARRNSYTGVAKLRVVLNANGTVTSVEPVNSLPYGLTDEAVKTARSIQFVPATDDGVSVSAAVYIEQDFVNSPMVSRTFNVKR